VLATCACSHTQLTGAELDRVQRPAYVGRLAEGAGPKAQGVAPAGPAEADLLAAMNKAIGKFEVAERLRSQLAVALRGQAPWSNAVPASQVASALETFLVERDPPVPPDYNRLKPTGADAVLEIVVEEYGLRADGRKAVTFLLGYARLFLLADGSEVWRGDFERSATAQGLPGLDGARLASDAGPYADQLRALLDASALGLAQQLSAGRAAAPVPVRPSAPADASAGQPGPSRAPPPDLTPPADVPSPQDRVTPKSKVQPAPDLTPPSEQPITPKQP